MLFLNIMKSIVDNKLSKNISQKKINRLIYTHYVDKKRIAFIRSKLKYGKVFFQLEYQYYKGKYLINTVYKPILINQAQTKNEKHSVEYIADYVSIKKDIWGFLFFFIGTSLVCAYIYVEAYNYIYVDLGDDPRFLCFKPTISRINSNYFEILLKDEPILGLVGNHDLCPNSDFLLFIVGCSECKFSSGLDFFVNEFKSIFGYSNIK